MKFISLLLISGLALSFNAYAQKEPTYAQKAEEIKTKVWGDAAPEFAVKDIPADMQKESAVIIARSFTVEETANGKIKMNFWLPMGGTKTSKLSIYREKVKINDKASLKDYSSLEYQKTLNNTAGYLYVKNIDKHDTYIGVKIIKPDGTEVIANTDEEVLTKNDAKDKQGKLAISNLQVGDVLDYYVANVAVTDMFNISGGSTAGSYLWVLAGEYPTLSYNINLHYNSKINVNYISANNAPDLKMTAADNGDKIYSLQIKNMPKYDSKLWTSTYRQYPYIQLASSYNNKFPGFAKFDKNESRLNNTIKSCIAAFDISSQMVYLYPEGLLKSYYKSGKALRNAPLDSSMEILYNAFKYTTFCEYGTSNMDMSVNRNTQTLSSGYCVVQMTHLLHDLEIDYDVLLVSPRTTSTLSNVFDMSDVKAMIRINNGAQPLYMCFDDMFNQFNEIPASYQGEEAICLSPRKHAVDKFDESKTTVPVIGSDKNYINSTITMSLLPDNMQKTKITRTVTEAGFLRHDDQQGLVLIEDYDHYFTGTLHGDNLTKRMAGYQNGKKLAAEYAHAFEKAREDIADNFKKELKSEFDEEPQDFTYKIQNIGLANPSPLFSYTGTFTMGNFVKTAGNNYILEVGKLVGPVTQLEDKQRQRTIDVYMSGARSFNYDINIDIPKGYQLKGVDELNKQVKNETGMLTVKATVSGSTLNLKINRAYLHNFEKAAQWPKLVEVIDAMYDLSKQKVLLEKI